jgi:hypothetical protein
LQAETDFLVGFNSKIVCMQESNSFEDDEISEVVVKPENKELDSDTSPNKTTESLSSKIVIEESTESISISNDISENNPEFHFDADPPPQHIFDMDDNKVEIKPLTASSISRKKSFVDNRRNEISSQKVTPTKPADDNDLYNLDDDLDEPSGSTPLPNVTSSVKSSPVESINLTPKKSDNENNPSNKNTTSSPRSNNDDSVIPSSARSTSSTASSIPSTVPLTSHQKEEKEHMRLMADEAEAEAIRFKREVFTKLTFGTQTSRYIFFL